MADEKDWKQEAVRLFGGYSLGCQNNVDRAAAYLQGIHDAMRKGEDFAAPQMEPYVDDGPESEITVQTVLAIDAVAWADDIRIRALRRLDDEAARFHMSIPDAGRFARLTIVVKPLVPTIYAMGPEKLRDQMADAIMEKRQRAGQYMPLKAAREWADLFLHNALGGDNG